MLFGQQDDKNNGAV